MYINIFSAYRVVGANVLFVSEISDRKKVENFTIIYKDPVIINYKKYHIRVFQNCLCALKACKM